MVKNILKKYHVQCFNSGKEFKYLKSKTDKCSTILSDAEHLHEIFCYQRKGKRRHAQK